MRTFIDKVEILSLEIKLFGERDLNEDYDFGALTLKCEDRKYILDTVQAYWSEEGGFSTIQIDLEKDEEIFSTCKYDLKAEDFISKDLEAEFYLAGTFSNSVESITLFVKNGEMTQAINVEQE